MCPEFLYGGIDYPCSPVLVSDFLLISGWCLAEDGSSVEVTILNGDDVLGTARTGIPSPLVHLTHKTIENSERAGFQHLIPLNKLSSNRAQQKIMPRAICRFKNGRTLNLQSHPVVVISRSGAIREDNFQVSSYTVGLNSSEVVGGNEIRLTGYVFNPTGYSPQFFLRSPRKKVKIETAPRPLSRTAVDGWFPIDSGGASCSFDLRFSPRILGGVPAAVELIAEVGNTEIIICSGSAAQQIIECIAIGLGESNRSLLDRLIGSVTLAMSHFVGRPKPVGLPAPDPKTTESRSNILVIAHNVSPFEGAPRVLLKLLKQIRNDYPKTKITVLSLRGDSPSSEVLAAADMFYSAPQPILPPYNETSFAEVVRLVNETVDVVCPDLVLTNVIDSFPAVFAAKRRGVDVHWMIHESKLPETAFLDCPPAIQQIFLHTLQLADRLLFVSTSTADLYRAVRGAAPISIVSNGIELSGIDSFTNEWTEQRAKSELGITDELVISIIGTVDSRKGQDIFVREMAILKNLLPNRRLKCFIVGCRGGEFLKALRLEISGLNLTEDIVLVDENHNVGLYLQATDIVCICSREESAPLVALEAMGFRKPIVSTAVFGLAEQLRDQLNALIFDPTISGDLASKVETLVNEPPLREKLAVSARATVEKKFSFQSQYDVFEQQMRPYLTPSS